MIVLLRGEATRHSISIRIELAEDLPKVMADLSSFSRSS